MKRNPLPIDAVVGLDNKYVIDAVIGLGANCIVYDGHYLDGFGNKKSVKLKECYPVIANVKRSENALFWENDNDKKSAYARFEQSYQIASRMQNSDTTRSTVVYSLDLFDYNNTKYVAMIPENGNSYEKDTSENIEDIIRTALALTNAVGRYHRSGYLHLDVKPANFIATADHTGKGKNIALFDLDTIVPIDSITGRSIQNVSYSKGWAAPEQMQQQIGKLCPATDLFSVGAILFERIMKRQVENGDMSPLAIWEFDGRFDAKSVNPKAKRLLTDIFHKTLASNVKKRFQSADELSVAMQALLDVVASGKPYIISSFPMSTCHFVGRSDELEKLHNAVTEARKVFVSGSGGIGKSELAKRYIALYADDYDAVVFMRYTGSVAEVLRGITVKGVSDINDKLKAIEELCDSRTMLVLDNFDVALDEDDYLGRLLSLGCDMIITTRTDFSDAYPDMPCIRLKEMVLDELRAIFEAESSKTLSDEEFFDLLPIVRIGEQCTLYWALLARLLKKGDYSLKELCVKASAGLSELDNAEDILNTKDGIRIKQTVAKAMSNLFKLTKLTPNQSEILLLLYHLDCLNLSKNQIKEIISVDKAVPVNKRMNALNDLIERGFVDHNLWMAKDALTISDVIKDAINYDLHPSVVDSSIVKSFIEREFFVPKDFIVRVHFDDEINKDKMKYKFRCIFKIIRHTNLANSSARDYYVDLLYRMIGAEENVVDYIYNEHTQRVVDFLNLYSHDKSADAVARVKASIILVTVFCYQTRVKQFAPVEDKSMKNAGKAFNHALKVIEQNSIDGKSLIDDLCRPFAYCAVHSSIRCKLIDPRIIEKIIELQPACIDPNVTPFKSFGVRVFCNSDYEKRYLYQVKKRAAGMESDERKDLLYRALGKIMLCGEQLPYIIDHELYGLRKELLALCADRFEEMKGINPRDFAPDPLGMPKLLTIGKGLECFKASISTDVSELVNLQKERSKLLSNLFGGEFAEVGLSDFPDTIQSINSAKELYDAIVRFRYLVDFASIEQLSEEDKGLLSLASEKLEGKFSDRTITDDFPYYDGDIYSSAEDIKAMLHSINAVFYCLIGDELQVRACLEKVLEHSRTYISDISDDAIINFEYDIESDSCFWGAVNRLNDLSYADIILPYLLDYTSMVEKMLNTYSDYDASWMYNYYKKIVSIASTAKEASLPSSDEERVLWAIFRDDNSEEGKALEVYNDIIQEYTLKIEMITGSKYHL